MIKFTKLLVPLCMGAMLSLGACATAPKAEQAAAMPEKETVVESTKQASVESDSETLICKRQAVVGSKFHRKVCATAKQWKVSAEKARLATSTIQGSKGPGTSN